MRKLVILRGAPGVGKSTFIKQNDLDNFTLSTDVIRLMYNSLELTKDYKEAIPQFNNSKVWNTLYYLLEERMKKGEFTIIDAVHASRDDFKQYKKLAEKYRYRLYVIDFTKVSKGEVYVRNEHREEFKIVPKYSIDKAYKKFAREEIPNGFKVLAPCDFESILYKEPQDFNRYENVHIIGDIHGCYSALKSYFEEYPIKDNDAYIFLGDYFDRGIQNYETYNFLNELIEQENVFFLMGNHEDKLYKYACDDEFSSDYGIEKTIEEFNKNEVSKSEIRGFIKKLSQILFISFRGREYIINHGGIPYFPSKALDYYSTNSFVYGVSEYDNDIDEIYSLFMEKKDKKIYQIHGHRNYFRIEPMKYEYSYNLDGDIEHGGSLRVLNLNEDGLVDYTIKKNNVYNKELDQETSVYNLIKELRKNKYVLEKRLDENISSFNFTREAFYDRVWNNQTVKARGLFIDTSLYKVVARSYDKFFNVGERMETKLEVVKNNFTYPINFFLKYNGFLGILSVVNGELFFASKSTNIGNYAEYFKKIFFDIYNQEQIRIIKEKIIQENASFVFEVIDPINDPHIIKYKDIDLVLLDIVYNELEFKKVEFSLLKEFAESNNIRVKELIYTAESVQDFESIYTEINSEDFKLDNEYVEGFVLEGSDLYMAKIKTKYYSKWKYLRSKMETAIKTNNYKLDTEDELEIDFMKFLKSKYENMEVDYRSIKIIDEREEFLTSNLKRE